MKSLKQRWIDALHDKKFWTIVVVILMLLIIAFCLNSCAFVDKNRAVIYYDQEVQHFPETE
jgi:hypothetical protein